MIEKTLKTTDGKLQVRIPTAMDEITMAQLMAMQEKQNLDDMDAISILSGVPKEDLYTVRNINDFEVFGDYVLSLSHQIRYLYNSDVMPRMVTFTLGKRKVPVVIMGNLSVEPAGAFLAARDIIADEINEHISLYGEEDWRDHFQPSLKSCCRILAHYFFCRATGKKYDEYEAEAFCEEIKKLRVTEALPIARHFFSCYPDLLKQRISFSQHIRQYWRKKLVSRRLKSSGTSIQ